MYFTLFWYPEEKYTLVDSKVGLMTVSVNTITFNIQDGLLGLGALVLLISPQKIQ